MATTTTATNDDQWLSNAISEILNSPHISFPTPPSGIHLGPGPIDLFSTKFDSTFASDVKVSVDGKGVTRDELKTKLLGLQKHWNPEEVTFKDKSIGPILETIAILSPGKDICMAAETQVEGGRRFITLFTLDGNPSLFQ